MRLAFTQSKGLVVIMVVLTAILVWAYPLLSLLPLALLAFIFYFFRDPRRRIKPAPGAVLAPADGRVTKIARIDCDFVGPDAWEVSIFMSPLDVHVNRSPVQGMVKSVAHRAGKFLPAMNPNAPLCNEKRSYCLQGACRVKVVQIAGILARRTVNWVEEGEKVEQGAKIGMIKFSSCTQTVFPGDFALTVKEGDKVRAGLSSLGEVRP
ncbi:MAG: phosphatidylserine decarboxylase [Bacillota bacterium]